MIVPTIQYDGNVFVGLEELAIALGGRMIPSAGWRRPPTLCLPDRSITFLGAGTLAVDAHSISETRLQEGLLLIGHDYFISVNDLQCILFRGCPIQSFVSLQKALLPIILSSPEPLILCQKHSIKDFSIVHHVIQTHESLATFSGQVDFTEPKKNLNPARIVLRRKFVHDQIEYFLGTTCDNHLDSFIVEARALASCSRQTSEEDSLWASVRDWILNCGEIRAMKNADPRAFGDAVILTVDMCPSLRSFEKGLIDIVAKRAIDNPVMFFLSGRWMMQHPVELRDLKLLQTTRLLDVTWGLHSFSHPSEAPFMANATVDEVTHDVITLETLMIENGIVPSVYYRFPALQSSSLTLRAIVDLDLLPIDSDAWLATMSSGSNDSNCALIKRGSIVLVHGNGNEPTGIELLGKWTRSHPHWYFEQIDSLLTNLPLL